VRHGIAPNVQEPAAPIAQGWSRFELLAEDGETVYYVTICPDCPTEAELPYIRFDEGAAPHEGWKLPSIRRYVGDRPFAWVDDDISLEAHRWAERRSAPTLLLDIGADCGLGEEDVERLLAFAHEAHTAESRGPQRLL
jgi:hypothetical protein